MTPFIIEDPILLIGAIVLGVLVVAQLVILALRLARPGKDFKELSSRTRAWWIMAAVFFGAILLPNRFGLVLFAFMSFWAMKEYVTLLKTRPADHHGLILSFMVIPIQFLWIALPEPWYGMFIIFIPVFVFLFLPMRLVLARETTGFVASVSQIQWGLMAFVFGLSHLAFLLTMPTPFNSPRPDVNGRTMILFLVFVVEISDVLQFVWGKTLGRHKIIPTVSPNKTWEGFIGGVISAVGLSLLIRFLTPFSLQETVLVSLLITIAGFSGGAVMSAVKRDLGVKDFGSIIPGHGGMLDRVDSLCFAAPVFFHYVRYFFY